MFDSENFEGFKYKRIKRAALTYSNIIPTLPKRIIF